VSTEDNNEREAIDLWIRAQAAVLWLRTSHYDPPGTKEEQP
jgi:hypothetical protein